MPLERLSSFSPTEYVSAARRAQGGNFMRPPSANAMCDGTDRVRAFKGPLLLGGKTGSRLFFNADQAYAGLGTHLVNGAGSAFAVRRLLMAIGAGQVNFDGSALSGFVASSTLSYVKKSGGSYGPTVYQAGRAQPSAPLIFAKDNPSAGKSPMSGGVSVVIWRSSDIDGQVSLMSLPSNVLLLSGQSVIVQMPSADLNGQTHWGIGVPKIGFDDLGYFLQLPTSLGGEVAEADLATIDGVSRAVEISWTNGAIDNQPFAPDKAFPPAAAQFAGNLNDVLFLDADGIIYVGDVGFIGSFPPKRALFASEPAVHYLRLGQGAYGRFGKHSVGALVYVGGETPLEYQELMTGVGIQYPQNACLGFGGRLLMFLGVPCSLDGNLEPDYEYASKVLPDFAGWDQQTASKPVVPAFDPLGLYECWCFGKIVMAKHAPSGRWSAPIDLTGKVIGDVVAQVTTGQKLYLACMSGSAINLYQFDAGTGSTMVVQTDDTTPGHGDTVSEQFAQVQTDDDAHSVKYELVKDYDTAVTLYDAPPSAAGKPVHIRATEQVLNAETHAHRITVPCAGGDAFVQLFESYGTRQFTRL